MAAKTASEEIAARRAKYAERQHHTDVDGRVIGVSRLRPSELMQVQEMTPHLDGSTTVEDDDPDSKTFGKVFEVAKRTPAVIAASVREIDGQLIPFPKTRAELFGILDRLEDTGLSAAGEALGKFNVKKTEDETDEQQQSQEDQAKN